MSGKNKNRKAAKRLMLSALAVLCAMVAGWTGIIASAEKPVRRVFIGDSRTVGMHEAVHGVYRDDLCARNGEEVWSAWSGKGIAQFPLLVRRAREAAGGSFRGADVYILLGVNDLHTGKSNPSIVAKHYRRAIEETKWDGARVHYISVNPVCENGIRRGPGTNRLIRRFNLDMAEEARSSSVFDYWDTAHKIPEFREVVKTGKYTQDPTISSTCVYHRGYTKDGLHYIAPVYRKIYRSLMRQTRAEHIHSAAARRASSNRWISKAEKN